MKFFTNFPQRRLEWLLALYTVLFGFWLALPPQSMSTTSFRAALFVMSEFHWGVLYCCVGIIHNTALHINGRAAWTPFIRVAAVMLNMQVFLAMSLSLAKVNIWSTGTFTYGFIALGLCGTALFAAAHDCGRELKIWRERKNAKR